MYTCVKKLIIEYLDYTLGKNIEGDKVIIGFRLSSYAAGCTAVGPIDDLCHIPKNMKTAVKVIYFILDFNILI